MLTTTRSNATNEEGTFSDNFNLDPLRPVPMCPAQVKIREQRDFTSSRERHDK